MTKNIYEINNDKISALINPRVTRSRTGGKFTKGAMNLLKSTGQFTYGIDYKLKDGKLKVKNGKIKTAIIDFLSKFYAVEHDSNNEYWLFESTKIPQLALKELADLEIPYSIEDNVLIVTDDTIATEIADALAGIYDVTIDGNKVYINECIVQKSISDFANESMFIAASSNPTIKICNEVACVLTSNGAINASKMPNSMLNNMIVDENAIDYVRSRKMGMRSMNALIYTDTSVNNFGAPSDGGVVSPDGGVVSPDGGVVSPDGGAV